MPDSISRVRDTIKEVLDAYGVPYEAGPYFISFTFGGHTRKIAIKGGDIRAHKNAKTRIRRILRNMGATPLTSDGESVATSSTEVSPEVSPMLLAPEIETGDDNVTDIDTPIETPSLSDDPKPSNEPAELQAPQPRERSVPNYTDRGYVVLNSIKYRNPEVRLTNGRFIAIHLERDLMAERGTVLVVPLDIPNVVWDMSEAEYNCNFEVLPPPAETIVLPVMEANDESERLESRAVLPVEPAPSNQPAAPNEVEPSTAQRAASYPPSWSTMSSARKLPVAPQTGRVMLAMLHLHETGVPELTLSAIQKIVGATDGKSVSAVLSGAIKERYVLRIASQRAGSRYKLSATGNRITKTLGTAPFDQRNLPIPGWLETSLSNSSRSITT